MKRILSILLSITIVASMLVSMSVTSFAATTTPTTKQATITTTIEELDDVTDLEDFFMESTGGGDYDTFEDYLADRPDYHVYMVTTTYGGLDLSSTIPTSNRYSGTYVSTFATTYIFDEGAMANYEEADLCWVDTNDDDPTKIKNIKTSVGAGFINNGTKLSESAPYAKSVAVESDTAYFVWYVVTTTDTFDMEVRLDLASLTCCTVDTVTRTTAPNAASHDALTYIGARKTTFPEGEFVVPDASYTDGNPFYSVVGGEIQEGGSSEPVTHAFTVYAEDGSVLASADVEEGAAIEMPTAPAVTGKTFSHWSLTEGGAEVEPETVMGTEDLTYYAVYETNKYTITFNVDGATTTQTVEYGVTPSYAGTPSKEGYTFTGWDKDFAPATADTTYTAQFAIKTYTITFIVDGATTTKTVNHGETPDYGSTPSKAGYNFTGWTPAIVAATENATYTAQFSLIPPTEYEITFVVDGVETKINVIEGQTPVYPNGTPAKDGYNFTGWTPAIVPATGVATYTAQFELIPVEPTESVLDITAVDRITGDIFPGSTLPTVDVIVKGATETIEAARLHRVHTKFDYEAGDNPLVEMGMLFVPKAVADKAGVSTADAIVAAGIAKDANCSNLPAEITGGTTNVVFKAGLINVPEAYKGITIYAIPYYTLSGGARQYHGVIETTF